MKKLLSIAMILIFFISCENAQKSNGFIKGAEGSSWQMGTQASVDLVVELDKYWGVDYDKMRTFFADTVKARFEDGKYYENVDGFIGHVKETMDNPGTQNWGMGGAFSIDLDPTKGGDWVNAWFMVDATDSKPKRRINEWYYVKNGKIVAITHKETLEAKDSINANGKIVTPGFIDLHTHSDASFLLEPTAQSKVRQGVTLELIGNCGMSTCAPLIGESLNLFKQRTSVYEKDIDVREKVESKSQKENLE